MPTLQLVQVHTEEQVAEIMAAAGRIADEWAGPPDLIEVVFGKAVDLLAARIPLAPVEVPLPLGAHDLARPRH